MPVAFRKLEVDIRSCVFLAGRRHMDKGGIAMPKSVSQRKKLLTLRDLIDLLEAEGIEAERKSIYRDLETLEEYGLDIQKRKQGARVEYAVGQRQFELPELKLLVDAIQSSRFITRRKSDQLIRKVAGLASRFQADRLRRSVYVANRVKAENESIYYLVDELHTAMEQDRQITFQYQEWAFSGEGNTVVKRLRREGAVYEVSPWQLIWSEDNYYLVGFDKRTQDVRHYRVDKMRNIDLSDQKREGYTRFERFDPALYVGRFFGMFGGQREKVTLRMENSLLGVVMDRFGEEVSLRRDGEDHFLARIEAEVSPQFLAWVFGLGDKVCIVSPQPVAQAFCRQTQEILRLYPKDPVQD